MAIGTYDYDNSDLSNLLQSNGISDPELSKILNYVFTHNPNHDGKVPTEVVDAGGSPTQPVPDQPFNSEYDHDDQPQVLVLESSSNQVNTSDFPNLQFIVQGGDANLEVTGDRNVTIVTGDLNSDGTGSFVIDLDDYGNDTVVTGDGNDTVYGGEGTDSITTGDGSDDRLVAGHGDRQTLQAGDGNNDTLIGGSGEHDSLDAGGGDHDHLRAGTGDFQTIQAGDGMGDVLHGGSGSYDSIVAGLGPDDRLYAGSGDHQTIQAGDGTDDVLYGGGSHDLISGGGDSSTLYADDLHHGLIGNYETLLGGSFAEGETLVGGSGSFDVLEAGTGDTSLEGGSGSHQLLIGGAGNDTFTAGIGGDTLEGGSGNNLFKVGDVGNDTIVGGSGSDTIEFTDYAVSDEKSTHTHGGVTTITFNDGQKVSYSGNITIQFDH